MDATPNVATSARRHGALVLCIGLAACDGGSSAPRREPTGSEPAVRQELLTDSATMLGWISDIVAQGIRRPGYAADEWVEGWARDRFVEFGLEEVSLDAVDVQRWEPQRWELSVWHPATPSDRLSLPCYPVPFSGATDGLEADLAAPAIPGAEVQGKIAVMENAFLDLPQTVLTEFATWFHDPAGEVPTHQQTLPFAGALDGVMEPWIAAGALGFVGILRGLSWDTDRYYVPYDGVERPIPGVWLSSTNGDRLLAFLAAGPARGRLELERSLTPAVSHNVTGVLRGASDEWIVIRSHHDGPWASAVEDASGTALVVAQARYWSRIPTQERPHNLLFVLNAGHMSGGAGLHHFIDTRRDFIEHEVVVEIHLEHAAREARGVDGKLVATDAPEFRWWFTSLIPRLEETVASAICAEDLGRSLLMPPEGFPPGSKNPPTDAAFFHPLSPLVSFLTAPAYLFDEADTIDKVHEPSLVPLTRAAIRIIGEMRGQSASSLRGDVYVPPRSNSIPPCSPAPGAR